MGGLAVTIEEMQKKHDSELEGLQKNHNDNKEKVFLDLEEINKHLGLIQVNIDDVQNKSKESFDNLMKLNDEKDNKRKTDEEKRTKEVEEVKQQMFLMLNEAKGNIEE